MTYRARARRARRFRRDRRGVVSVVGTLLSMLVFFALFGVFLTQYLPIWMAQNESQLTYQAQASLATLKQYVDDQAIFGGPRTYAVPFTMSSQGIPLFAQPTQGSISFRQGGCAGGFNQLTGSPVSPSSCSFQRLNFSTNVRPQPGNLALNLSLTSTSNYLVMQLPNRYYPSQTFYFEDDAIVAIQAGGQQRMLVPPPLSISSTTGNTTLSGSFVQLIGNSSSFQSQGTKDVYASLQSNQSYSSFDRFFKAGNPNLPFNATFSVGTVNPCAWYSFLTAMTNQSTLSKELGLPPYTATGFTISPATAPSASSCLNPAGTTSDISLSLWNINFAQAYSGIDVISFSVGGL